MAVTVRNNVLFFSHLVLNNCTDDKDKCIKSHGFVVVWFFCPGVCGKRAVTFLICHRFLSYVLLGHRNQGIGSIFPILISGSQVPCRFPRTGQKSRFLRSRQMRTAGREREYMDMVYTYIDV